MMAISIPNGFCGSASCFRCIRIRDYFHGSLIVVAINKNLATLYTADYRFAQVPNRASSFFWSVFSNSHKAIFMQAAQIFR